MRPLAGIAVLTSLFLPLSAAAIDKVRVYSGDAVGCESSDATMTAQPTMSQTDLQSMDCLFVKEGTVLTVIAPPEGSTRVVRVLRLDGTTANAFWISTSHLHPAD